MWTIDCGHGGIAGIQLGQEELLEEAQILQPASVEEIELAFGHEPKTINGCGQVSTGFNVASCPHVTSGTSDRNPIRLARRVKPDP